MQTVKCVLVGDYDAGKTHLLMTYTCSTHLSYIHTMQNHSMTVMSGGQPITLDLWDLTSISDYDRLRPLCYHQTDVFLVCFSVVSPSSYENVKKKWVPDVKRHCPDARFLLVGTRTDLRDDPGALEKLSTQQQRPLTPKNGEELARKLKAAKYVECSAETKEGLKELFDEAILVGLGARDAFKAENVPETDESKKNCLLQ